MTGEGSWRGDRSTETPTTHAYAELLLRVLAAVASDQWCNCFIEVGLVQTTPDSIRHEREFHGAVVDEGRHQHSTVSSQGHERHDPVADDGVAEETLERVLEAVPNVQLHPIHRDCARGIVVPLTAPGQEGHPMVLGVDDHVPVPERCGRRDFRFDGRRAGHDDGRVCDRVGRQVLGTAGDEVDDDEQGEEQGSTHESS